MESRRFMDNRLINSSEKFRTAVFTDGKSNSNSLSVNKSICVITNIRQNAANKKVFAPGRRSFDQCF